MLIFLYSSVIFFSLLTLFFSKKISQKIKKLPHQKFTTDFIPPLIGGYFIIYVFLFYETVPDIYKVLYFSIFLIGTLSDFKILNSPSLRLFLQIIIILLFVESTNLYLENTRLSFLDEILKNYYFNIIFCSFCILIVINGTNFIDGLNGLVIGYYLMILLILSTKQIYLSNFPQEFITLLILLFSLIFILNQLNKIYLGDSGSYFLGFFVSTLLIQIYIFNQNISPYFVILLIWYPCFENLFSIIRKYKINTSPLYPDNYHLHHLIFKFFDKEIGLSKNISNNLTSTLIIFYNFIIIFFGSLFYQNTKIQISLILFNIVVYVILYIFLGLKINYKKIDQ